MYSNYLDLQKYKHLMFIFLMIKPILSNHTFQSMGDSSMKMNSDRLPVQTQPLASSLIYASQMDGIF